MSISYADYAELADVLQRDPRYPFEAYEFIIHALKHTQKMLDRMPRPDAVQPEAEAKYHVSGRELLDGVRDLALREFGLMARVVFRMWGIERTDDVGEIVFNLIDSKKLKRTENDTRADFHEIFDLDQAFKDGFHLQVEEKE